MKKLAYLVVVALLAGCAGPAKEQARSQPPLPPMPVVKKPLASPKATSTAPARRMLAAGNPVPVIPSWAFTNLSGSYAIDASTNLTDWWPAAEVYYATNVTIISDTVTKRPMIFYRVRPIE